MKLISTVNRGVVNVSEELAEKLVASGLWEAEKPASKPRTAKATTTKAAEA